MKKIIFFFFLISCFPLIAQEILPFVENYSKQDYKGDNQIWDLTQGADNALYFANNRYLLRYNGVKWEKNTLPNKTIIRSVFSYKDFIFSGSFNEFGYWTRVNGSLTYQSLVPENFFSDRKNEEVWKIMEWKGEIYFQTFNEIYVYDFKNIRTIKLPEIISYLFIVNDRLLAATVKSGVLEYKNNKFEPVKGWEELNGKIIYSIEYQNDTTYIFTQKNGIYLWKNNKLEVWNNSLQNRLINEIIITAAFTKNNQIIIGTSSGGVYIVDVTTNTYQNLNRNNSLQNNTVLSIFIDKEKDVWLGLDNGVSHIEINSPFSFFTDKTGTLGSVYAIANLNDGLLLGTNHGLFSYNNTKLDNINHLKGQIWNIYKLDNQYVIGHNDGTYLYKNGRLEQSTLINGGWNFHKDVYHNRFFQANYTGLALYPDLNDFTKAKNLELNIGPLRDFVQISENEIMAVHNYKGIYKLKHSSDLKNIIIENITKLSQIDNDFEPKLFKYNQEILFLLNNHWYAYDKNDNQLKSHELFNENFKNITEIIPIDTQNFAVVKNENLFIIKHQDNDFKWQNIPSKLYNGRLISNETKITHQNHQYIVNLDDGFMLVNDSLNKPVNQQLFIEAYYKDQLLKNKKVPNNETVEINFISEYFGSKKATVFYNINDSEINPVINGKLIINNLRSGTYKINAFINDGIKMNKINTLTFKVKKAWYFSFWMILFYAALIFSSLYLYYRWNKQRFKEKLKLHAEEIKHKSELMRLEAEAKNQIRIQELEKLSLENQVQLKANELAGKSLSLAKQTELIESVQEILDTENSVSLLKSKIAKAIKINRLNKNEWKSFENNLLKSNEDFVKILTSKYPVFTSKDIKLSIYLKMNLSSKEIAPLMNISYRGVELHRYRLRKKMNVSSDINLNVYMNSLK